MTTSTNTLPLSTTPKQAGWMAPVLRIAGIYNLIWGALVVLLPVTTLGWLGLTVDQADPIRPIWQCVGMIVGVYGIGYWVAAPDVARHWPIVLVGFLGKIFGPIGFVQAVLIEGVLPASFGWTLLTNDLVWWIPFALMLAHAWRVSTIERSAINTTDEDLPAAQDIDTIKDQHGNTLAELSRQAPHVVVFLRHAGCTFCREALADLSKDRARIEQSGAKLALVHMGADTKTSAEFFAKYDLGEVSHIGDPDRTLYRAFDLQRGNIGQLFGLRVWVRGFIAGILHGHLVGTLKGDGFQMPGAFLVRDGRIVRAYRHQDAADRPNYAALAAT